MMSISCFIKCVLNFNISISLFFKINCLYTNITTLLFYQPIKLKAICLNQYIPLKKAEPYLRFYLNHTYSNCFLFCHNHCTCSLSIPALWLLVNPQRISFRILHRDEQSYNLLQLLSIQSDIHRPRQLKRVL